jgi:hypothetical protein
MKRTARLGPNHYIRLDSYGETSKDRRNNFLCTLFVIAIACMTAGAMVGVDITNLNPQNNENTHCPGR